MDIQKQKCSSIEHKEIDANSFCGECKIYMCNKCETFHSKLFSTHKTFILDKEIGDIFTGYCKEEKHNNELQFFCKTHNQLCCAVCLCKIKKNDIGKHKDCDVCNIEDIKNEKKKKLKENIKFLEEISNTIEDSINKLKNIYGKINGNKEQLKLKIQKIFTKIRNGINNREDALLLEVDKKFENLYIKEDIIKDIEKLPNKIKISLEKGKLIDKEDNKKDNNLSLLINNCIILENNIKEFNLINENIKKCNNSINLEIEFNQEEKEVNEFLEKIKIFGKLNSSIKSQNESFNLSSIIKDDINKQKSIINWIIEKTNKNNIKFELIFKMTEDGYKCIDFYNKCENKGPTLILIKTTKNKIFGGFTPLNWKKGGGEIYDRSNQTFIFSLNLMKKYDIINKKSLQ